METKVEKLKRKIGANTEKLKKLAGMRENEKDKAIQLKLDEKSKTIAANIKKCAAKYDELIKLEASEKKDNA